jgi:hypothetical protein
MDFFTEQHFQKLIAETGQPDSRHPAWLGDALAFMVEHSECFPPADNYFDPQTFGDIIEWMRLPTSGQPLWLADALAFMVEQIAHFPSAGNEDAYIVEYIYPH